MNDEHEPVIVTRACSKPVVMLSLEGRASMDETTYLLSPANRAALLAAVRGMDHRDRVGKSIADLRATYRP